MAKYKLTNFIKEDVNPYKISNRLFDHTATTANIGSTGEELNFNLIEITPDTFTIEYRITSNSPNRPIGASRNYRSEPKEGVTEIKKDFNDPKSIQVRGTNFTVRSGEFMDQVYGDAASVAEGEFKFRPSETDAPGMQAGPDGYLKESTIKVGNTSVKIEYAGKDKDYIGFSWKGEDGKDHYEETRASDHKNMDSLVNKIKDEIGYPNVKEEETINESIDYIHMMKVRAGIIK